MILKKDRSRSLVKKLRWNYLFAGIIGVIVIGSIIMILNTNTNIEAKKEENNSTIIIDKDTDTPLSIPKISTRLHEAELKNNLNYHDFVQNNLATRTLNKGNINLWSNQIMSVSPIGTQKLDNGHYLLALRGTQKRMGGSITFAEVDENGTIHNSYDDPDINTVDYSRIVSMLEKIGDGKYLSYGFKTHNGHREELFFEVDLNKSANGKLSVTSFPALDFANSIGYPHEIRLFGIDKTSGDAMIGGFVSDSRPGSLSKFKIPIGTFNLENKEATYKLSLNNFSLVEIRNHYTSIGEKIKSSHIIPMDIVKLPNGDYFSIINYYDYFVDVGTPLVSTVQVFDSTGKRKEVILPDKVAKGNSTGYDEGYVIKVENSFVYYFIKDSNKSYIKRYNYEKNTNEIVRTFPKETYLKIAVDDDGSVNFSGYTSTLLEDDFVGFYDVPGNFIIFGMMEEINKSNGGFKIINLTPYPVNSNVLISYVDKVNDDKYFISGSTTASNFGTPVLPSSPNHSPYFMGLFGSIVHKEDYSPAIYAPNEFSINLNDPELQNPKILDNWLLTGSKKGTFSDPLAIKVTDIIDLKNPILGDTVQKRQTWLNQRINKNFENPSLAIDWPALGFDLTKPGPQSVNYFISDSQKQLTSTSRWVNAFTNQTTIEKEVYLDAANFSIPLKSVKQDIPTEDKFKELAQTMSWNQVTHEIYEDGKNKKFSEKVTVNPEQLKTLQEATEAKPYPVDVTIEIVSNSGSTGGPNGSKPGENGDDDLDPGGSGIGGGNWVGSGNEPTKVTNRVWVFVTTKNTVVDTATGIVIYADDYKLPLQSAKNESMSTVYEHANVKVYDYYDNSHETVSPLPTIADSSKTEGLTIKNLGVITDAQKPSIVNPEISYTWDKGESFATPDVTLYAELLLHTKQVVLNESEDLPIPNKGYLRLMYGKTHEVNVTSTSDIEKNNPVYVTSTIDFNHVLSGNEINFSLLVPEYYSYKGYTASHEDTPHHSSNLIAQNFQYSLTNDAYEIWLTLYIEPTKIGIPKPYSWDYQKNKFGKITIE